VIITCGIADVDLHDLPAAVNSRPTLSLHLVGEAVVVGDGLADCHNEVVDRRVGVRVVLAGHCALRQQAGEIRRVRRAHYVAVIAFSNVTTITCCTCTPAVVPPEPFPTLTDRLPHPPRASVEKHEIAASIERLGIIEWDGKST
jgi:hypothetical protein